MDKINASINANTVFIQRIYRKYVNNHRKDHCKKSGPASLSILAYEGAIILFFGGVILGWMAFGSEFLFHTCFKQ